MKSGSRKRSSPSGKRTPSPTNLQRTRPQRWNTLIEDPEVFVLDTVTQTYIGTFQGATDPKQSFTEIKATEENLAENKGRKIAMFCTGDIRFKKLSAHMLNNGYKNIFQPWRHPQIPEDVPEKSLWKACFVFDTEFPLGMA